MGKKLLLTLFFLSTIPRIGMTQNLINYGFESGFTFSEFPTDDKWSNDKYIFTTKTNPIISPLLGISKEFSMKKHFRFSAGIQYQMAGNKLYRLTQLTDSTMAWSDERWTTQLFHKLCFPLNINFVILTTKLKPTIYIGLRPNLIFAGREYSKVTIHQPSEVYSSKSSFVPFGGRSEYFTPARRLVIQFSTGLSTNFGQHFRVNLNYNFGQNHYISRTIRRGNYSTWIEASRGIITSSDYTITITYLLKNTRNKESIKLRKPN